MELDLAVGIYGVDEKVAVAVCRHGKCDGFANLVVDLGQLDTDFDGCLTCPRRQLPTTHDCEQQAGPDDAPQSHSPLLPVGCALARSVCAGHRAVVDDLHATVLRCQRIDFVLEERLASP